MAKRHNKTRNTAFLYEVLIVECTKASMKQNMKRGKQAIQLIREFFNKNSELGRDLQLHRDLLESKGLDEKTAEKFLNEVKQQKTRLNEEKIFEQQTRLIGKIRKILGESVFDNFIPDYRSLASVSQILNEKTPVKTKVLLESSILKGMTGQVIQEKMLPVDNLVYKTFVKRFNEQYGSILNEEQSKLISKYVMSIEEGKTELSLYLDKEIGRLKEHVAKSIPTTENEEIKRKLNLLQEKLEGYKREKPDDKMITSILKIQNLAREL